jgi:uncharacterized protein YecE (DUF72 family)
VRLPINAPADPVVPVGSRICVAALMKHPGQVLYIPRMSTQLSLFGADPEPTPAASPRVPGPGGVAAEIPALAAALPSGLRLGTSSWSFPGWAGLVYDRPHDASTLSRHGLAAYAAHPLLRTVSIDRAYYAPLSAAEYEAHARQVPADFRFMVKAPAEITASWMRGGERQVTANPRYLDLDFALRAFVEPVIEGLGERCGPLVFQFPPQGRSVVRAGDRFLRRLETFLAGLPAGPVYAVELRDPELWTAALVDVLRSGGARLCISVHPRAPTLDEQAALLEASGPGEVVVRWNLNPRHRYEEAKERYAPFDRLMEPDVPTREALAALLAPRLAAGDAACVVANNKAEGSAPRTIAALAEAVVNRL